MQEKCIFNNEDFKSSDGMLTYVWGPSLWHFLHTMSFNYPVNPTKDDKQHYMNFIHSLKFILPCKYCRMNLSRNLKETHFSLKDMKSRDTFSKYVFNLHNHINKMLGKKNTLSYQEVRERYENFRSRCTNKKTKTKKLKKFDMNNSNNSNNSNKLSKSNIKKIKKCLKKKEKGCITPITGIKSKCIIQIVPKSSKKKTFTMDPKCQAKRLKI